MTLCRIFIDTHFFMNSLAKLNQLALLVSEQNLVLVWFHPWNQLANWVLLQLVWQKFSRLNQILLTKDPRIHEVLSRRQTWGHKFCTRFRHGVQKVSDVIRKNGIKTTFSEENTLDSYTTSNSMEWFWFS
jgi:hypothetical protein